MNVKTISFSSTDCQKLEKKEKQTPNLIGVTDLSKPDTFVKSNITFTEEPKEPGYLDEAKKRGERIKQRQEDINILTACGRSPEDAEREVSKNYPDLAKYPVHQKKAAKEDTDSEFSFWNVFKRKQSESASNGAKINTYEAIADTGITLEDVGGLEQVKGIIQNRIIGYINNPERFKEQGVKMTKGVLLYGPPGTGKTLLAKAIAGTCGVPFLCANGSEFINQYVGVGSNNVRELFKAAREAAMESDKKTAIVFIDELDSVGGRRTQNESAQEHRQTLNQLLTEMDGLGSAQYKDINIVVMGATNLPDDLDEALVREGRFDYKLEVPNPARTPTARKKILEVHSRNKKFEQVGDVSLKEKILLIGKTISAGMSGSRIEELINRAAMFAALRDDKRYITEDDLQEARLEILAGPIVPSEQPEWYKIGTAGHECAHAVVGELMNEIFDNPWDKTRVNSLITLQERGQYAGALFTDEGDNPTASYRSTLGNVATGLAAYQYEILQNGGNLAGVAMDIKNSSEMITDAVTKYGMGPRTKQLCPTANPFVKEATSDTVKADIISMSEASSNIAKTIITYYKPFIDFYIEEYKKLKAGQPTVLKENLSGDDFKQVLHNWSKANKKDNISQLKKDVNKIITDSLKVDNVVQADKKADLKLVANNK
jgi:ATP-dependent Zn protease